MVAKILQKSVISSHPTACRPLSTSRAAQRNVTPHALTKKVAFGVKDYIYPYKDKRERHTQTRCDLRVRGSVEVAPRYTDRPRLPGGLPWVGWCVAGRVGAGGLVRTNRDFWSSL